MLWKTVGTVLVSGMLLTNSGCMRRAEVQGAYARIGCYRVTSVAGGLDFSVGSAGTVNVAAMNFDVLPVPEGQQAWQKITGASVSCFRDINGNGKQDPTEPGNTLSAAGDGTPADSAQIGGGTIQVGSGTPGAVHVNIEVTTASGSTVAVQQSTFY